MRRRWYQLAWALEFWPVPEVRNRLGAEWLAFRGRVSETLSSHTAVDALDNGMDEEDGNQREEDFALPALLAVGQGCNIRRSIFPQPLNCWHEVCR